MELIIYVIFLFTLLLIIFSINEYYESCLIKTCLPKHELITTDGKTSCKPCSNTANVDTFENNTCKITKCTGTFTPNTDGTICGACSSPNALTYSTDGLCTILTCNLGYKLDATNKTCVPCTNTSNVYTYGTGCSITQCNPGYDKDTGSGESQKCLKCSNNANVDVTLDSDFLPKGYDVSGYAIDKSNVPNYVKPASYS